MAETGGGPKQFQKREKKLARPWAERPGQDKGRARTWLAPAPAAHPAREWKLEGPKGKVPRCPGNATTYEAGANTRAWPGTKARPTELQQHSKIHTVSTPHSTHSTRSTQNNQQHATNLSPTGHAPNFCVALLGRSLARSTPSATLPCASCLPPL